MSAGKEPAVLMCLRKNDPGVNIPGVTRLCEDCGVDVHVTYASLKAAEGYQAKFKCMECVMKQLPADKDVKLKPPTKEQVSEVQSQIHKDLLNEMLRRFGRGPAEG